MPSSSSNNANKTNPKNQLILNNRIRFINYLNSKIISIKKCEFLSEKGRKFNFLAIGESLEQNQEYQIEDNL